MCYNEKKRLEYGKMERIRKLIFQYRHELLYLIFGALTTLVNFVVYLGATRLAGMGTTAANALAWLMAVLFAYLTNRTWVFESQATGAREIGAELLRFMAGRVATGLMDIAIMYVSVDLLGANDVVMKILSNVLVIILNYVISKLMVFRKK